MYKVLLLLGCLAVLSVVQADVQSKEFLSQLVDSAVMKPWIHTQSMEQTYGITAEQLAEEVHASGKAKRGELTPVVIVASLIGSKLFAKLHDDNTGHWYCSSDYSTYYQLWFDETRLYPFSASCFFHNIGLLYNSTSFLQTNQTGVKVEIKDFGGVESLAYLGPGKTLGVWNETIALLENLGYEVGKTLFGCPYDWRVSPANYFQPLQFPRLKALIEDAYTSNGGKRVFVTSLSMGGPYFLSFLNNFVDQAWKDKYLTSYVSLDGAFGGSVEALNALLGVLAELPPLLGTYSKDLQHMVNTMGSFVWMAPWEQVFQNEVFVRIGNANYTSSQFPELLRTYVPNENSSYLLRDMKAFGLLELSPPGVETHIVHGTDVPTALLLDYPNPGAVSGKPNITYGNGDSTIPIEGLTYLKIFNSTKYPIYTHGIKGMIHGQSVKNPTALRILLKALGLG